MVKGRPKPYTSSPFCFTGMHHNLPSHINKSTLSPFLRTSTSLRSHSSFTHQQVYVLTLPSHITSLPAQFERPWSRVGLNPTPLVPSASQAYTTIFLRTSTSLRCHPSYAQQQVYVLTLPSHINKSNFSPSNLHEVFLFVLWPDLAWWQNDQMVKNLLASTQRDRNTQILTTGHNIGRWFAISLCGSFHPC